MFVPCTNTNISTPEKSKHSMLSRVENAQSNQNLHFLHYILLIHVPFTFPVNWKSNNRLKLVNLLDVW